MSNNGNNKFPIDCPHCNQRFSVEVPPAEVVNTGRVSMVVTAHPKPIKCICGGSMVLVLTSYQLGWGIHPINEQQAAKLDGSKIIAPPEGIRLIG